MVDGQALLLTSMLVTTSLAQYLEGWINSQRLSSLPRSSLGLSYQANLPNLPYVGAKPHFPIKYCPTKYPTPPCLRNRCVFPGYNPPPKTTCCSTMPPYSDSPPYPINFSPQCDRPPNTPNTYYNYPSYFAQSDMPQGNSNTYYYPPSYPPQADMPPVNTNTCCCASSYPSQSDTPFTCNCFPNSTPQYDTPVISPPQNTTPPNICNCTLITPPQSDTPPTTCVCP